MAHLPPSYDNSRKQNKNFSCCCWCYHHYWSQMYADIVRFFAFSVVQVRFTNDWMSTFAPDDVLFNFFLLLLLFFFFFFLAPLLFSHCANRRCRRAEKKRELVVRAVFTLHRLNDRWIRSWRANCSKYYTMWIIYGEIRARMSVRWDAKSTRRKWQQKVQK